MATLHVILPDRDYRIPFGPGLTLRQILNSSEVKILSACGGTGACGLCRVRVRAGEVDGPTATEMRHLSAQQLRAGIRLACQLKPRHDLMIDIEHPLAEARWHPLPPDAYPLADSLDQGEPRPSPPVHPLGVAIDLGTTQIRLTLWSLAGRRRLAGRSGANPQATFGADVLTRVLAAVESDEQAGQLAAQVREAIGVAVHECAVEADVAPRDIGQVVVVGNTAMLALMAGKNFQALLQPDSWERPVDCRPDSTSGWGAEWGLPPEATIDVIQPLAGFVGSDLLAGLLATRLLEGGAGSLLIDFGTNSELALWDGATLWVTSAAGGPAFEGCGLRSGMPAGPGAIVTVAFPPAANELHCQVLGGIEPRGLCGSGMVDAIAALRRVALLNRNGRLVGPHSTVGFHPIKGREDIVLTQADVDIFQRAKAAVAAGILCLLATAGMEATALRRVCVGGAFGRFLEIANAEAIGLLPPVARERVELCGNTALLGCESLLLSRERTSLLERLRTKARTICLSTRSDFDDLFIANLALGPWR